MYECINRTEPFPAMDAFEAGSAVAYTGLTVDLSDPNEWPVCRSIMEKIFVQEPKDRPSAEIILKMMTGC